MKANNVLKILRISRSSLYNYVKSDLIQAIRLPTGRLDYDEQSVYKFLNKDLIRNKVIYARVSTQKQKKDLENQIDLLKNFSFQNGWQVNSIYSDIASGISFDKRKDFFIMLDEILNNKIEKVIVTYKDRLSRVGFGLFSHLFKQFGTEIVVLSDTGSNKLDSEEIFEEIIAMLHCYSMKLYSKRKHKIIKEFIKNEAG